MSVSGCLPSNTWFTITLTGESFAGRIEAASRIAITALAAIARYNIEVTILAFITIAANDIWLTTASASYLITNRYAELRLLSALWITGALVAIAVWQGQRITKVARQTLLTILSSRVVDTLQTFAGRTITIADGVRINIAIAIA